MIITGQIIGWDAGGSDLVLTGNVLKSLHLQHYYYLLYRLGTGGCTQIKVKRALSIKCKQLKVKATNDHVIRMLEIKVNVPRH